jgi:hypothetical protein
MYPSQFVHRLHMTRSHRTGKAKARHSTAAVAAAAAGSSSSDANSDVGDDSNNDEPADRSTNSRPAKAAKTKLSPG